MLMWGGRIGLRQPSLTGPATRQVRNRIHNQHRLRRWQWSFRRWSSRAGLSVARPWWARSSRIGSFFDDCIIRVHRGHLWRTAKGSFWQGGYTWGAFAPSRVVAYYHSMINAKKLNKGRNKKNAASLIKGRRTIRPQPLEGRPVNNVKVNAWQQGPKPIRRGALMSKYSRRQQERIVEIIEEAE